MSVPISTTTELNKKQSGSALVINQQLDYPKVSLIEPSASAYIHIAAEVDQGLSMLGNSRKKAQLIADCKKWCKELEGEAGVIEAVVFKAALIPRTSGKFIETRKDRVHIARFDFAVLVEVTSVEVAERIREHPAYQKMEAAIREAASYIHIITATNVRRMNPVDHKRKGVFLFNYFFADNTQQNIDVWEYTAGWFEKETGLDNSTVLLPIAPEASQYNIVNHCRWDRMSDILPSLLFKRTFHTYVLNNFDANNVAAMPILYRLA